MLSWNNHQSAESFLTSFWVFDALDIAYKLYQTYCPNVSISPETTDCIPFIIRGSGRIYLNCILQYLVSSLHFVTTSKEVEGKQYHTIFSEGRTLDNSIAEINQHFSNANVLKSRKSCLC